MTALATSSPCHRELYAASLEGGEYEEYHPYGSTAAQTYAGAAGNMALGAGYDVAVGLGAPFLVTMNAPDLLSGDSSRAAKALDDDLSIGGLMLRTAAIAPMIGELLAAKAGAVGPAPRLAGLRGFGGPPETSQVPPEVPPAVPTALDVVVQGNNITVWTDTSTYLKARISPAGVLWIDDVSVERALRGAVPRTSYGLYKAAFDAAEATGVSVVEIRGALAFDNEAAYWAGGKDFAATPAGKARAALGFSEHSLGENRTNIEMVSRRPGTNNGQ